jgi:autotransporter-associated beta strand protein
MRPSRIRRVLFAAAVSLTIVPAARGQLDPNAFSSLGTLNVMSGTLTINTDTLAMSGAATFAGVALNQNGGPQVAVFDFASISIGSGVTVNITGTRALALLSQGGATVMPALSLDGGPGTYVPGPGGYQGGVTSNTASGAGAGPGGGGFVGAFAFGGGYGGAGGSAGVAGAGQPYGNLLSTLAGGSGGGSSSFGSGITQAYGGGGGGGIEIGAVGAVSVGSISAAGSAGTNNGGNSSAAGGAGGGILLNGSSVTVSGSLTAAGGGTSPANTDATGGGGGRIALLGIAAYVLGFQPSAVTYNLNGGNGSSAGFNPGSAGVMTIDAVSTTIPSGTSVTLTSAPVTSIAGSTTQTAASVEAHINRDLVVNAGGTATLGMDNVLQHFDSSGHNVTVLTVDGTFNLNGYSQTVAALGGSTPGAAVNLAPGSVLTVGGTSGVASYAGQITGPGGLLVVGPLTLALNGSDPFTGPTTVTGGATLVAGSAAALANSTVTLSGSTLSITATTAGIGALGGTGSAVMSGVNNLTVGGNGASTTFAGNLSGSLSGGLNKAGAGTWTLTGSNTQSGPLDIQAGAVLAGAAAALSPTAPITVSAGATLDLNGYGYAVTSANPLSVQGNFRLGGAAVNVASGATAIYNGGFVSNGFLRGPGTQTVTGGATLSGVTTAASSNISVTGAGSFVNFTNGAALTISAGVSMPATFDLLTNQGSGSITVGATSAVNASDFQTYGTVTINPAMVTQNFSQTTLMTNTGTSQLFFNGGSRTFIGTPATAVFPNNWPDQSLRGLPTFVAGIDLNGKNATVAGGLFVNNGYVEDTTNNGQGTAAVVADFGSLVKGAGYFQNSVQTINGGKFQAGNSPGSASFGKFVLGPGGVSSYVFAIDDATGSAGPSPDAAGHVSGWGLVKATNHLIGGSTTPGDFVWTATPADKLLVSLETLVNPTTVGTDVPGLMDHFDPTLSYAWPAVEWSGNYAGPGDTATLDAATSFGTSGFANPVGGDFGWALDAGGHTLSLTYTPSAVPEPGTLVLTGLAAGVSAFRGRRRKCDSARRLGDAAMSA